MRITRRHLQFSLAVLWLLDAALQCQPIMFSRGFARRILDPATQGQPAILAQPLHLIATQVSTYPAVANGAFITIQILLGLGLLTRRFTRVTLVASIAWALSVWIVGEGLGGVTTGSTILSGAPGAALLYAVIAALAWPARTKSADESPSRWAPIAWSALWLIGAALQLLGGNNSAASFTMMLRGAQSGSPGWIERIDHHLGLLRFPYWSAACVVALYLLIAMWALVPGWTRRLSLGLGMVVAMTGWLLVQGLGDLTSGQSTDLNTGPLIVLLALAGLGATHSREVAKRPLPLEWSSDTAGSGRRARPSLVTGS